MKNVVLNLKFFGFHMVANGLVYDWLQTFPTENVRLTLKIIDCRNFHMEISPAINYTPC